MKNNDLKKMNNKGFTLIEILAVVVILGIIGGIATIGVTSSINKSKLRSEKIFVDKLSNLIDDYLDLYPPKKVVGTTYTFKKCQNKSCTSSYDATANQVKKVDGSNVFLKDLVTAKILSEDDLVNPKNKEKCLNDSKNPEIKVYKDSDFVYYYYVDLSDANTSCQITSKNGIINTLPDKLNEKVGL